MAKNKTKLTNKDLNHVVGGATLVLDETNNEDDKKPEEEPLPTNTAYYR